VIRGFTANPFSQARLKRTLWQSAALGIVVALAGHFLLIHLFRPAQKISKHEAPQGRFTVMLNPSLPGEKADVWGLRSALKYGDPTLFAKPDELLGFSSYRNMREADSKYPAEPPERGFRFSLLRQGNFEIDIKPWKLKIAPPSEWLQYADRQGNGGFPDGAQMAKPPLWLDASYNFIGELSDKHGEIAKLLASTDKAKLETTVIFLKDEGENFPPEAHVFKSCGVVALDTAALRSLSVSLNSMPAAIPEKGGMSILLLKWTPSSEVPPFDIEKAARK